MRRLARQSRRSLHSKIRSTAIGRKAIGSKVTSGFPTLGQPSAQQGFALSFAIAIGLVVTAIGITTLFVAQSDRQMAQNRKESGSGLFVAEGGIARMLAQFSQPNNSLLTVRNVDSINPKTNKTYLGPDGIPNSGDEESVAIDEWTGYNPSNQPCLQEAELGAPNFVRTGAMGSAGSYTLRSYRYDTAKNSGTLLVEGIHQGRSSFITVTFSVTPDPVNFPGVVVFDIIPGDMWRAGVLALRGRQLLGRNSNVYYTPASSANPFLTGSSLPESPNRSNYLNAIWSNPILDGAKSDTVQGKILACNLMATVPDGVKGTNLGVINTNTTLKGLGGEHFTLYQFNQIDLTHHETLTIDTTGGPVQLDFNGTLDPAIHLRGSAKIINIRTDGKPPRVGDLRILNRGHSKTLLENITCIQNAFLYMPVDELRLFTSGPGCPGGRNTNVEGVIWAEAILSSKVSLVSRDVYYLMGNTGLEYNFTITPGATSGIAVPEDVSSLMDLNDVVNWPMRYRIGEIQRWQRVRL